MAFCDYCYLIQVICAQLVSSNSNNLQVIEYSLQLF